MNALIVYDSQFGNTERIALSIADALHASGGVRAVRIDPAQPVELQGTDLLIVGSPTQGWRATQAMQTFLNRLAPHQLRGVPVACFDTRFQKPRWLTGSAAGMIAKAFQRMGLKLLLPPESFFVAGSEGPLMDGELDRAATWAVMLSKMVQAPQPAMS